MKWTLVAIVVSLLCLGGYWYANRTLPIAATAAASQRPAPAVIPAKRQAPDGMRLYESDQYRFSLIHPPGIVVREQNEGQGAMTLTFEDLNQEKGFQIFIVPYIESQVSEERFKMDIPSGVRIDMKDISIDGALGASFYSEHAVLGETAEIWFVRDGYLYEVTTLKPLEGWLNDIMKTWEFTKYP